MQDETLKSIGDAPNLREDDANKCAYCRFYKYMPPAEGWSADSVTHTPEGQCTKHDFMTRPGLVCDDFETETMTGEEVAKRLMESSDAVVTFGDVVKHVKNADGSVTFGGYLVRFGSENDTDLEGDYFTKSTDFGPANESLGWFNHRLPVRVGSKSMRYADQLPTAKLKRDEIGIYAEIILTARNEYEAAIIEAGLAGRLGWSSGTAPHLVDVKPAKNGSREILRWPLGMDASLTPTPAESRNSVTPLKSLSVEQMTAETNVQGEADAVSQAAQSEGEVQAEIKPNQKSQGDSTMDPQAPITMTKEEFDGAIKSAADLAVKSALASAPAESTSTSVTVTRDPADVPFTSIAANLAAVKNFEVSKGQNEHPRIKFLKAAQGATEGVPSDGGLLLDPTLVGEFLAPLHEDGPFSKQARKLPVSGNSNYGWINGVDETSRATGSRWGGVRGYRIGEAGQPTGSKPNFRRINWELKKYAVLVWGTDELLADAAQFSAIVNQACREELVFMFNDDIFRGVGVSGAQGFINSGARIQVTRTDANLVQHADIVGMWNRVDPRSRKSGEWFINNDVQPQLDKLYFTGTTSVLSPYVSYNADGVMTLYGRPVNVTEFNPTLGSADDIVFADMKQYLTWEKAGIDAATSIHVQFLTDETAFRFIYRADGKSALASALTPYQGTVTTSPFVVLTAAS